MPRYVTDIDAHLGFSEPEPPSGHPSKALLYRPVWAAAARLFESHGVVAHLTGRGGDNLFCGDGFPPLYLAELLRSLHWSRWWREVVHWASVGKRSYWNLFWHCSLQRASDQYAGAANRTQVPSWLTPAFRDAVREADAAPWYRGPRLFASPARELQYRSIVQTAAVARFIRVGDERHPLFHRPLVEFVLALPWEHLLRPTQDRVIQRRAMKGLLPDEIRQRKTKTSGTPVLLRGMRENWPRLRRYAAGTQLARYDLVDPSAFRSACERLRHGLLARQFRYLAGALSLEIWLDADQADCRDPILAACFDQEEVRHRSVSASPC